MKLFRKKYQQMIKYIGGICVALSMATSLSAEAVSMHCDNDTTEISTLVASLAADPSTPVGKRIVLAAESFIGKGADDFALTDSVGGLRLNVDTFTPMSFVNSAIAAGKSSMVDGGGWRAFNKELTNYSCRRGEDTGLHSIFYHTSDWIGDNIYRGNLIEQTDRYTGDRSLTASLDYMSVNRDKYPALANDSVYDRVRMTEMGFRSHKIPYLPKQAIGSKDLLADMRDGDIIVMVSSKDRSDWYRFGIVKMESDGPYMIYYDVKDQQVVVTPEPLKRFFAREAKYFNGFRWLRVAGN